MATPKEQLLSRTVYDTDGTTTIWDFAFSGGYLDPSHVKAYTETPLGLRTQLVLPAGSLIGQFQLRILPALAAGNELVIYRDTPKNLPLVDFTDESGFSEIALDTNAKQGVFIAAEAIDTVNSLDVAAAINAAEAAGTSALAAQASQAAASSAANGAAISQSAANSSASAALAAQLAAESARNVAATEAAAAAVSATSANTSRTQAQDAATAAQASATSATASQTAAANSATTAGNAATSATASQTAAANSATAAANSATAAADSATSAATSATAAANSAASVNPANLVQVTGDQTIGGTKTFTGRIHLTGDPAAVGTAGSTGILEVGDPSGNTPATMSFHKQGFAINMGLDADNVFRLGGWSQGLDVHRWTSDTLGNFTALGNITAGGQFIGNGAGLTNLSASNIASGTVPAARLGSGAADNTTFLRGDNTWQPISVTPSTAAVLNATAGAAAGGVGTYAFMLGPDSTTAGATIAGSSLFFANASGGSVGSSGAGTWRCMGTTGAGGGAAATTLWLRIS